jgi:hypothetical protein
MTSTYATLKETATELAERTADSYSYDGFGAPAWRALILWLLKEGYNERQVEAIVRSKHTRWARDIVSSYRGSSKDFARYWSKGYPTGSEMAAKEVDELVSGTFFEGDL